jgi:acetate kinase
MNILVLNCGSSSVKFQLLEMTKEQVLAKGLVERIGAGQARIKYKTARDKTVREPAEITDHTTAIDYIIRMLTASEQRVIESTDDIDAVGHRVVHGGESFAGSMLIDDEVYAKLQECIPLAPLHNPANIKGIDAVGELMPTVDQAGVFDTAFHQSMPRTSYLYALPLWVYERHGVRRYGFHGTSHRYVAARCAELEGRDPGGLKIITCHLGNGASVAAVDGGVSLDTSMGFTPLEGLVMGSRCGDIDPAIPLFLQREENLSAEEVDSLLNRQSGVKGLSEGEFIDMRDIEDRYFEKDPRCTEILEIYCYRIRKYIGAYAAAMSGVDAVVFTAGVGENSPITRKLVCDPLAFLGLELDDEANDAAAPGSGFEGRVTAADSRVGVWVIPTNEELVIARDTKELVEMQRR